MRGIKVLALAGLATKQSTRWFQLQHNNAEKKCLNRGWKSKCGKRGRKERKKNPQQVSEQKKAAEKNGKC